LRNLLTQYFPIHWTVNCSNKNTGSYNTSIWHMNQSSTSPSMRKHLSSILAPSTDNLPSNLGAITVVHSVPQTLQPISSFGRTHCPLCKCVRKYCAILSEDLWWSRPVCRFRNWPFSTTHNRKNNKHYNSSVSRMHISLHCIVQTNLICFAIRGML
jgi:hypothetical protein